MAVYVGWDVSTSIVGICALDENKGPILWRTIDLRPEKELSVKYELLQFGVRSLRDDLEDLGCEFPIMHVIEERLGGFSKGFTNQNTLLQLAAINAVATYIIESEFKARCMRFLPVTVKSAMKLKFDKKLQTKKEAAVQLVSSLEPTFPYVSKKKTKKAKFKEGNWVDGVDDMADAYMLAVTGIKNIMKFYEQNR
jgi:hypothetical protein